MNAGQTLEVIAELSCLRKKTCKILTRKEGFELVRKWKEDDRFHFLIKKL